MITFDEASSSLTENNIQKIIYLPVAFYRQFNLICLIHDPPIHQCWWLLVLTLMDIVYEY